MIREGYLLGFDLGSSSIKASLVDIGSGMVAASATSPDTEMPIVALHPGWAEQDPTIWWKEIKTAAAQLRTQVPTAFSAVRAIGISYQMHGLVVVDKELKPLRPSIIWCDSRAAALGDAAYNELGSSVCLPALYNSPGNFTAAKLKWVKENEPELFSRIKYAMLPGDFIALQLTGEASTTFSGLSEGILWDFSRQSMATFLLEHLGISPDLFPAAFPSIGIQGTVLPSIADELQIPKDTVLAYRAGDQPNNALSLKVLEPGDVAATAGTSAVVYGVGEKVIPDPAMRVNTFLHVNHSVNAPRLGVLLCINGAGALMRWLRNELYDGSARSYKMLDDLSATSAVGADGLVILPFGNGAERILQNKYLGASFHHIELNRHGNAHITRAAQEGIAFSLTYGMAVMREMGVPIRTLRVGHGNMFLSDVFREAVANSANVTIESYSTDGSQGAARAAGLGSGLYSSAAEALSGVKKSGITEPSASLTSPYLEAYNRWTETLNRTLSGDS